MNDRQKELLRTLLIQNDQTLTIMHLANQLECAEKTVRNDLKKIESVLADYQSAKITRQPGIGITLEINNDDRTAVFQQLLAAEPKSQEDRLVEMAYQLLVHDKPTTLQQFSAAFFVPKQTVKKELASIANWLSDYQLELVSKPRVGNIVEGDELHKRSALAHLSELISSVSTDKTYVMDLFYPYEITTVQRALDELQQQYAIAFTDGAIESLLVHALIMMKRTRQKSPVTVPLTEKETVIQHREYAYAVSFFAYLEEVFKLSFSEDERIYFTWHLISSKKKGDREDDSLLDNQFLAEVIETLIARLSDLTLFAFGNDDMLKSGLTVHIHSVINRLKYGFPITNPLLPEIKKMYPYMFNMVMIALSDIKEKHRLEVPEDEAAYLVLHFQASVERLEASRERKRRALIVCHMGVGMSHLLQAKVEQHYQDMEIVACVGKADLNTYLDHDHIDLIISTIDLSTTQVPYVRVTPLLESKDKQKLNQFLSAIEHKELENKSTALSSLIRGDLVQLQLEKEHPFQVIEQLGNVLYEKGIVEKSFIHSAVLRERRSATSIGGGIAIPHGNPKQVLQSAIAVALLKEPMKWGDERVSIVFMLAISGNDQQWNRAAVSHIVQLSESPAAVSRLLDVKDIQSFINRLH
ncbi:BglG family transcription antiterminator [Gracilibacillus caseinilyticus]|uniref:BglG family transcription antiterminator n=1 Tax=Gracilibacillus caseinilyticus TaxID=2932256 RepID=A0ABY4EXQ1_9BACI|nr:BglG family transcription antiterminator [Gracilibacillus caseinilyticus]UOQ48632.1 BglG family transcription antiterminator [Gracilibacillus caseinilyticus]